MTSPSTGNAGPSGPTAAEGVPDGRGATRSTVAGERAPRSPNERDESSDSGTGAPSEQMRRAHDDAQGGKTATDKSEATDAVYGESLRGATPGRERDAGGR